MPRRPAAVLAALLFAGSAVPAPPGAAPPPLPNTALEPV